MPDRILRQYASVFFFAPLVRMRLHGHDFGLSDADKKAIMISTRWGYIVSMLGASFFAVSLLVIFSDSLIVEYLYWILMAITIGSIAFGVWRIHYPKDIDDTQSVIITNHMLTAFLPGYNRYLRYNKQDPHKPYRWIKESILWRYIIMVCRIFPGGRTMGVVILALMIIRIILLAAGYDILPVQTKKRLNIHYTYHADEWRSPVSAGIALLWDKRKHVIITKEHRETYCSTITGHPRDWSLTNKISYGILGILILISLWTGIRLRQYNVQMPSIFRGLTLLVTYTIIRIQSKHIGPVPIIYPIVNDTYKHIQEHRPTSTT